MSAWSHCWAALMDSQLNCVSNFATKKHPFGMRLWRAEKVVFMLFSRFQMQKSPAFLWGADWYSSSGSLSVHALRRHVWLTYCCRLFLAAPFFPAEDANKCIAPYLTAPLWGTLNDCTEHENLGKILASAGYLLPQEHIFCILLNFFLPHPT